MTDPTPFPKRFISPERRAEFAEQMRQNALVWEAIKGRTADPGAFVNDFLKQAADDRERDRWSTVAFFGGGASAVFGSQ